MAKPRVLIALGVVAALAVTVLALPGRSVAQPQDSGATGFASQGWVKVDSGMDFLSQDDRSVLIYSPYRGTLKIISKYQSNNPVRVIDVNKVNKPASGG